MTRLPAAGLSRPGHHPDVLFPANPMRSRTASIHRTSVALTIVALGMLLLLALM
ncbi:MAG: hypothetical protein Fur0037_10500 [Planctomycetota bacterium]